MKSKYLTSIWLWANIFIGISFIIYSAFISGVSISILGFIFWEFIISLPSLLFMRIYNSSSKKTPATSVKKVFISYITLILLINIIYFLFTLFMTYVDNVKDIIIYYSITTAAGLLAFLLFNKKIRKEINHE